jgi:hypothetical protein
MMPSLATLPGEEPRLVLLQRDVAGPCDGWEIHGVELYVIGQRNFL